MNALTRPQLLAIAGLVALSVVDIVCTLWGFANLQIFYEVNPLLAPFCSVSRPELFISAITGAKVLMITAIVILAAWFNSWDRDRLQGGNVCCFGALAVYGVMIASLFLYNSTRIIF